MRTLILLSVCAAGLCGCAESVDAPLSPTFGQAVASMDSQIIPAPISDQPPASAGVVGAAAVVRYGRGEVKQPESPSTSTVGGSGAVAGYSGK